MGGGDGGDGGDGGGGGEGGGARAAARVAAARAAAARAAARAEKLNVTCSVHLSATLSETNPQPHVYNMFIGYITDRDTKFCLWIKPYLISNFVKRPRRRVRGSGVGCHFSSQISEPQS